MVRLVRAEVTAESVGYLQELFAAGPDAIGSVMAGRAEEGFGDPDEVAAAVKFPGLGSGRSDQAG